MSLEDFQGQIQKLEKQKNKEIQAVKKMVEEARIKLGEKEKNMKELKEALESQKVLSSDNQKQVLTYRTQLDAKSQLIEEITSEIQQKNEEIKMLQSTSRKQLESRQHL